MPTAHIWNAIDFDDHPEPKIQYKQQDYTNSCFSACLQMALVNGNQIRALGRPIEDQCNAQFLAAQQQEHPQTLDQEAPDQPFLSEFLGAVAPAYRTPYQEIDVNALGMGAADALAFFLGRHTSYAIIGAILVAGGHAQMILKKGDAVFAINPAGANMNLYLEALDMQVVRHVTETTVEHAISFAPGFVMDYIWVLGL